MTRQAKEFRTPAGCTGEFTPNPEVAIFVIDGKTAAEIVSLAQMVRANDLYKLERFHYRVQYLMYDAQESADEAAKVGAESEVRTQADTLDVTDREFWFAGYIRHTDVVVKTENQSIAELAKHFGIRFAK